MFFEVYVPSAGVPEKSGLEKLFNILIIRLPHYKYYSIYCPKCNIYAITGS